GLLVVPRPDEDAPARDHDPDAGGPVIPSGSHADHLLGREKIEDQPGEALRRGPRRARTHRSSFRKQRTTPASSNPAAAWAATLPAFSARESEASSAQPCALAHCSAAATSVLPTPRLRKDDATNQPSRYATRSVRQPSAWGRIESSAKPTGPLARSWAIS